MIGMSQRMQVEGARYGAPSAVGRARRIVPRREG